MPDRKAQAFVVDEFARQQLFLSTLWSGSDGSSQLPTMDARGRDLVSLSGVEIYRSNGLAIADRALRAAFPTVCALLGNEGFSALAKHFWRASPPTSGDLGEYGATLATFVSAQNDPALLSVPFLSDIARLDWAIHNVERAADPLPMDASRWTMLSENDPAQIYLHVAPASELVESIFPIVTIFNAHQTNDFRALQSDHTHQAKSAWVHREGFRAVVATLSATDAQFTRALRSEKSLADALDAVTDDPNFDFSHWLTRAAKGQWIADITATQGATDLAAHW